MTLRWYTTVVDADDPRRLADFWAAALGWVVAYEQPDDVAIEAPDDPDDRVPAIVLCDPPTTRPVRTACISTSTPPTRTPR